MYSFQLQMASTYYPVIAYVLWETGVSGSSQECANVLSLSGGILSDGKVLMTSLHQ